MAALSDMMGRIAPSATVAITARAAEMRAAGRDVLSLSVGEPDFDTPAHIRAAAKAAIDQGHTRYTAPDGMPALKAAVARAVQRDFGIAASVDLVSVGTGGKQVIFNALMASLNPGDEVIVPAPYWVSYPDMVRICGGTPKAVLCPAEDGFKLTPDALRSALSPRTRWVILNSPGNPTGAVYSADELAALARVLADHPGAWVLSDDIYAQLTYAPARFATMATVAPQMAPRTLTVNGVSKAYAMTGWRIGYGIGPVDLIAAMRKIQSQITTNPSTIGQWAALAALDGSQAFLDDWRLVFLRRRDTITAALNAANGISCLLPDGAFYVFPSISGCLGRTSPAGAVLTDDVGFAEALLVETGVATVPGTAFGAPGHIRISFAAADAVLAEGCARIADFCAGLA